ncbi:MAG: potassium-transporting ATPase subunit KdpC [Clostridium perfringens]|nr:potassium-transporting ATPase subunit KdpC [Clostridium perfringens]
MKHLKISIKLSIVFIIVCGLIYPLVLTGVGQVFMNKQANGSLIYADGKVVGSQLIGQEFTSDIFFHGRPSSINYNTTTTESNTFATGTTDYSANSSKLVSSVDARVNTFLKENPTVARHDLPASLFTESASGLDPDITLQGAEVQIARVSKATGISRADLIKYINESKESYTSNGETLINVLELNIKIAEALKMI